MDVFGLDAILAELVVAIGAALMLGNAVALWHHRRGERPSGVDGELRSGRVAFLLVIGAVMVSWGLVTLIVSG